MSESKISQDTQKLLSKITIDNMAEAMENGWIVSWTVARYIVSSKVWDDLSLGEQKLLNEKTRDLIYESQVMKSVLSHS